MLSFFSKKKVIQENDGNDPPIPGPVEQNTNDDFIFVERKSTEPDKFPVYPTPGGMYPAVPPTALPNGQQMRPKDTEASNVPYVQGVPFVLAPQLADESQNAGSSTEIDRILAIITRQMSVDEEMYDYNFNLEKSVLNAIQ